MKLGMFVVELVFVVIIFIEFSEDFFDINFVDLFNYVIVIENFWIWFEFKEVRNFRLFFYNFFGFWGGMVYFGLDSLILKGCVFWIFRNFVEDYEVIKKVR